MQDKTRDRIVSNQFNEWLDEPIITFKSGVVNYSRGDIAKLTGTPCTRAASNLHTALEHYQIDSPAKLNQVGLDGLLRCVGVGERAALVAACIIEDAGYNIDEWIDRQTPESWNAIIASRAKRARRRKQPAV